MTCMYYTCTNIFIHKLILLYLSVFYIENMSNTGNRLQVFGGDNSHQVFHLIVLIRKSKSREYKTILLIVVKNVLRPKYSICLEVWFTIMAMKFQKRCNIIRHAYFRFMWFIWCYSRIPLILFGTSLSHVS